MAPKVIALLRAAADAGESVVLSPERCAEIVEAIVEPTGRRRRWLKSREAAAIIGADYAVLRHVREKWSTNAQYQCANALAELYRTRKEGNHPILRYMPGDYSRAALAVMEGE